MHLENKAEGLSGPARIGRVTFSKSCRSIHYGGRSFRSLRGAGYKANYVDVETGEHYWISGPRKDGADRLYGERVPVDIDGTSGTSTGRSSASAPTGRTRPSPTGSGRPR